MVRDNNNRQFAVVTGASSGIGYELARQFGEHGFDSSIVSEQEHIKDAARAIEETGAAVESLQADLATYEGVEKLADAIRDAAAAWMRLPSTRAWESAANSRAKRICEMSCV